MQHRFFMKYVIVLTLSSFISIKPIDRVQIINSSEPSEQVIQFIHALEEKPQEVQPVFETKSDQPLDTESGLTPCMIAAALGQMQFLVSCIDGNNKLNVQDTLGNTALHYATMNGQLAAAKILLCAGADHAIKNNSGKNAFHIAINQETVTYLQSVLFIIGSKDHNKRDVNGWTPLLHALFIEDYVLTEELLNKGARGNIATREEGITPLMLSAKAFNHHLVKLLIKNKDCFSTINSRDVDGNTALHHAVFDENTHAIKELILAGADIHIRNNKNKTALDKIKTQPVYTIFESALAVKKALCCSPKDLDEYDETGLTPLFHAIKLHDLSLFKFLIASGADVQMNTRHEGVNPYNFALQHHAEKIAVYLKSITN